MNIRPINNLLLAQFWSRASLEKYAWLFCCWMLHYVKQLCQFSEHIAYSGFISAFLLKPTNLRVEFATFKTKTMT